jgi:hypothetical protein
MKHLICIGIVLLLLAGTLGAQETSPITAATADALADASNYKASDLMLYQAQYQEAMKEPIRRDRSRRAWIGTGIGFGVNLVIVFALLGA